MNHNMMGVRHYSYYSTLVYFVPKNVYKTRRREKKLEKN